jgi:hypothetical protein
MVLEANPSGAWPIACVAARVKHCTIWFQFMVEAVGGGLSVSQAQAPPGQQAEYEQNDGPDEQDLRDEERRAREFGEAEQHGDEGEDQASQRGA